MMLKLNRGIKWVLAPAMVASLGMLGGCGAGSNNLTAPNSGATTSACTGDNCVTAYFLDEPVSGVNYDCDTVSAVTGVEGTLSCPNDSVATLYLKASNGVRKIVLGTVKIHRSTSLTGFVNPNFVYITPRDLVSGGTDLISITSDTTAGTKIINMLRLLQAFDSLNSTGPSPTRRIVITDADKQKIDNLDADFSSDLFGSDGFEDAINPVLQKLASPKSLNKSHRATESAAALSRFLTSFAVTTAGGYEVSPLALQISIDNAGTIGDYFMTGQLGATTQVKDVNGNVIDSLSNRAVESLLFLQDREGKLIGTGLEWLNQVETNPPLGSKNIPQDVSVMYLYTTPKVLRPVSNDMGFALNGDVRSGFDFQVLKDDGSVDAHVGITQGRLVRGFLFGHPQKYRDLFGLGQSEPVPDSYMGKWERRDAANKPLTDTYSGAVTLQKTRYQIDPFLDPTYFKTPTNTATGDTPIFPLHAQLTFRDNDKTSCPVSGGCAIGTIGISILENGNIISDINNDCGVVDGTTLKDPSGQQEYRLGLVTAILKEGNNNFISPLILIPDTGNTPVWQNLRGTIIGMTTGAAGGKRVKLNITAAASRVLGISDASVANSSDQATWVNYVNFLKYSQIRPTDLSANIPKAQGVISGIQPQTCYNPVPK